MIKEATLNELMPLALLFNDYRVFYGKKSDIDGAIKFLHERLSKNESKIFIALSDKDEYVGYVLLYPLFSSVQMKPLWLLNDLYVRPNFRGQGFGEALIEQAKDLAKITNAYGLMLETAKTNIQGNNLYRKTDWILDIEHNFYNWEVGQ